MTQPTSRELLARHAEYLKGHEPIPTFEEIAQTGVVFQPVLIITCADPRCIPEKFFKLDVGEAVVVRVPGGKPETCLPGILSVDSLVKFKEILVVQHTDCGATYFRDEKIKEGLKERAPQMESEIDKLDFAEITIPLEQSVRNSMQFLKDSPYIRAELKQNISGYVYDLKTGHLNAVQPAQ